MEDKKAENTKSKARKKVEVAIFCLLLIIVLTGIYFSLRFGPMDRRVTLCKLTNGVICVQPIFIPASEETIKFETCDKINDLYKSGKLEDMFLASYPKHLNESLVIDFDHDGYDEEIRFFEFNDYADIGQYFNDKRFMLWYHKNLREDHNGSNIIRLNGRYLVLMSFSLPSRKKFNPYKVSEVKGMTIEMVRSLGFTDEDIEVSGFNPISPSYRVLPICLHDGKRLKVWKRTQ